MFACGLTKIMDIKYLKWPTPRDSALQMLCGLAQVVWERGRDFTFYYSVFILFITWVKSLVSVCGNIYILKAYHV